MKSFLSYPNSLKNQVILVFLTLFLLVWGGFSLFLYQKADNDLRASLARSLNHINNELTLMIESEVRSMTSIVKNVSRFNFTHRDKATPEPLAPLPTVDFYQDIQKSWEMLDDVRRTRFLQYYDLQGNLLNEWGSSIGDVLDSSVVTNAYEKTYASSWFGCSEVCFLNVIDKAGTNDAASGSLRVGLLVDDIIHNFNELNDIKVTFFKVPQIDSSATDTFKAAGNRYLIEAASSYIFYQSIRPSLADFDFKNTYIFSENNQHYSVRLVDKYKHQGLFYALAIDVTDQYNEVWSKYNYTIWASTILLAFSLLMFYLILSKTTNNFEKLAKLMELIGKGDFATAEKSIPEKYLNYNHEIGLIYKATKNLNRKLAEMKYQLLDSNANLEKALTEKSWEHDFIESILDTSDIVIIVSDNENNISLHNRFSVNLFGAQNIKNGLPVSDFLNQNIDLDAVWEVIRKERISRSHSSVVIGGRQIHLDWIHCALPASYQQHKMLSLGVDISRHIKLENKIRQVAEYDQLTGLMNRRKFNNTALSMLADVDKVAYVAMDLDYFKLINDSMGHHCGDQLLADIADILMRHSKCHGAIVGRMGGDEFAMLIPDGGKETVLEIFSAIIQDISAIKSELKYFTVSMSSGVAFYPADAQRLNKVALLADTAMYENKRLKNKPVNFYTGAEKVLSLKMEQKYYASLIKKIIDDDMISLYFQPIVSLKSHETVGIEILVRVFDSQSDANMPTGKLISYAEKTGRVIDIDLQVLSQILASAQEKNIRHNLMINISNLSIANKSVSDEIYRIIRRSQYPFSSIVFEIIESSEIENLDATVQFIQRFKKLGVRFALDDFGSGFFSFFYLKVLPVDFLKIDKSIILDAISDKKNHYIIQAITQLAENLGIKVIAEGVEDQEILDAISKYRISYIQGYHIARPKPVAEYN